MSEAVAQLTQHKPGRVYARIAWRILPLVLAGYIIAYVDRVNIGFAKLQFAADLHFSEAIFGLGAGLFFIGYMVFEIPSNLYLARVGARATLSRVMILWGLVSAATAFVRTPEQFYVARFLLGAAEAGFFPGIILYFSYWFPAAYRGRITSGLLIGGPVSGIVGGLLSGWLLGLNGLHGLRGWQIVLIYEGLPAVLLGILVILFLPDRPAGAAWLSVADKAVIESDLMGDPRPADKHVGLGAALRLPFVWITSLVYVAQIAGTSAIGLWTPSIYRGLGLPASEIGMLTAIPYVVAVPVMILVGRSSDRRLERRWHFSAGIFVAGLASLLFALGANSTWITLVLISVAASAGWSAVSIFWTIPPTFLPSASKAAGIAIISSLGSIGGFVSPIIVGDVTHATGSLYAGLAVLGVGQITAAALLLIGVRAPATPPGA